MSTKSAGLGSRCGCGASVVGTCLPASGMMAVAAFGVGAAFPAATPRPWRVCSDGAGTYVVEANTRGAKWYRRLADRLSLDDCFGIASDTAKDAHMLPMVQEGAQGRRKARSEKPEAFARKLGLCSGPQ